MIKYCQNCGIELKSEDKFCLNCGINLESKNHVLTQVSKEETSYPSLRIPQPLQQKKSIIKLAMIIIAVILIVVFIAIAFILFGVGSDSRFIGTWAIQSGGGSTFTGSVIFDSNGDLKTGYQGIQISIGKWSIDGNNICLEYTLMGSTYPKICSGYAFSNSGHSLTIFDPSGGENNLVLTR